MLISLVAVAYLTNLPKLPYNLIISNKKSHVHNMNFRQSAVSLSIGCKRPSLLIQQQTLVVSH